MKLHPIVITLLCLLSPACGIFAGEREEKPIKESGQLCLDSLYLDFGTIAPDTLEIRTIGFRNAGTAPLEIYSIFTDCGCTAASYPTDPIAPGEKGEITVRFNSKGRLPGPFRKTLRIRANGEKERTNLIVKGNVAK